MHFNTASNPAIANANETTVPELHAPSYEHLDGDIREVPDVLAAHTALTDQILASTPSFEDLAKGAYDEHPFIHDLEPSESQATMPDSDPRIQAFAKLEFDDGHFYVNTYSFELGRDIRAARAAVRREIEANDPPNGKVNKRSSSGGNASHTPNGVKREGSGVINGSVVSERGGIMGIDPEVPEHIQKKNLNSKSSNSSSAESPQILRTNSLHPYGGHTDYQTLAMESLYGTTGDARPVDMAALMPSPDACPLIPIHPPAQTDVGPAGHRGISRKHVRIAYNFDKNLFEMEVLGRNGAFIGADWLAPGQVRPLKSGDYIQIGGVRIRFLLPDVAIGETGAEGTEASLLDDEEGLEFESGEDGQQDDGEDDDGRDSRSGDSGPARPDSKRALKVAQKRKKLEEVKKEESADADQQPPVKRRGPGRPPKDGIMSKRERAEIAREQRLAAKREANGGVTPPPSGRGKVGRPPKDSVEESTPSKPEKRKYAKRKKPDSTPGDVPQPSIEGVDPDIGEGNDEDTKVLKTKKPKPSKSPSPDYPPESSYSTEDLAKPPYNYQVLIFDALNESPTAMTLKQIYRALKLKYPYFRFKCETEGWTSSVRHNLNGTPALFEHDVRDGKGWSWKLKAGASVDKEKKRRPSPPPLPPPASTTQPHSGPPSFYAGPGTVPPFQPHHPNHNPYSNPLLPPGAAPPPMFRPPPLLNGPRVGTLPTSFAAPPPTYQSPYESPYASAAPQPPPAHISPYATPVPQQQQPPPRPPSLPAPPPTSTSAPPPPSHSETPTPGPPPNPPTTPSRTDEVRQKIDLFEQILTADSEDKAQMREIFNSVRARVLNGKKSSSMPGGEGSQERTVMELIRNKMKGLLPVEAEQERGGDNDGEEQEEDEGES